MKMNSYEEYDPKIWSSTNFLIWCKSLEKKVTERSVGEIAVTQAVPSPHEQIDKWQLPELLRYTLGMEVEVNFVPEYQDLQAIVAKLAHDIIKA